MASGAGIGLVQSLVGVVLYARTDAQSAALRAQLAADPLGFIREEGGRMDRVMTSFTAVEIVEIVLAIAGASLFATGELESIPELRGIGLSVGAEAVIMFGLDYLADQRAARYTAAIREYAASPHALAARR